MSGERLVAIFAHPDDESLLAGGTLAACAAAGVDVRVVSVTRGEHGSIATGVATRETLSIVREEELRSACAELGVWDVQCLDLPDGWLTEYGVAEVRRELERVLRACEPDVVMTFATEGLYWHPDHAAVHHAVTDAVTRVAEDGVAPWLYYATWPKGQMEALVAATASGDVVPELWGLDPELFGTPADAITTVVDVRDHLDAKLRAILAHRSQLSDRHVFRLLGRDAAAGLLGREYFLKVAPANSAGDWLIDVARGAGQPCS